MLRGLVKTMHVSAWHSIRCKTSNTFGHYSAKCESHHHMSIYQIFVGGLLCKIVLKIHLAVFVVLAKF